MSDFAVVLPPLQSGASMFLSTVLKMTIPLLSNIFEPVIAPCSMSRSARFRRLVQRALFPVHLKQLHSTNGLGDSDYGATRPEKDGRLAARSLPERPALPEMYTVGDIYTYTISNP